MKYLLIIFALLIFPFNGIAGEPRNLHAQGDKIAENDLFTVYTEAEKASSPKQCQAGYPQFNLSVVFNVDENHLFTKEFLYKTLFDRLVFELAEKHCPDAKTISTSVYVKDMYIDAEGGTYNEKQAMDEKIWDRPIVVASAYMSAPFESMKNLKVSYAGSPFASYTDEYYKEYVVEVGSIATLKAFNARGKKTQKTENEFKKKAEAANWPGEKSFLSDIYLGEIKAFSDLERYQKKAFKVHFLVYTNMSNEICGSKTPNRAEKIRFRVESQKETKTSEWFWVDSTLYDLYDSYWRDGFGVSLSDVIVSSELGGGKDTRYWARQRLIPVFDTWTCGGDEFKKLQERFLHIAEN